MTRTRLTSLGLAALLASPVLGQDLPVLRDGRTMCVSLDAHGRDAMVVLVKTTEKTAANLDMDRPADALLAAVADGAVQAFGRGMLDGCIEVSKGDDFALAAFSVGDRVNLLGWTTAQERPVIASRRVPGRGRDGRMEMKTVEYVADELVVSVPAGAVALGGERACFARDAHVADARVANVMGEVGAAVIRRISPGHDGLYLLEGVGVDPFDYCATADFGPGVVVEPNAVVHIDAQPGHSGSIGFQDPLLARCWGMHNDGSQDGWTADMDIDAPQAWRVTTGSANVVVAVIDTGVDYTHRDLRSRMWTNPGEIPDNGIDDDGNGYVDDYYGWDANNGDGDPMDDHWHGTHTSGTVAAAMNNVGVVGVAPGVRIMAIKAFSSSGSGTIADIVEAITYAADNGASITSNSWGTTGDSVAMSSAFDYAYARDVVSIASAGNNGTDVPQYPAGYDNVLSVAALAASGELAFFSNFGPWTGVAAPGLEVLSSVPAFFRPGGYARASGTSMACPHVSGVAALIRSRDPGASNRAVMSALKTAVEPLESTLYIGTGFINARKAVRRAVNPEITVEVNVELATGAGNPLTDTTNLLGTADGPELDHYVLDVGFGRAPTAWTEIATSHEPVTGGVLGVLDLAQISLGFGTYTVRLRAFDAAGRAVIDTAPIEVDNTGFIAPRSYDIYRAGDVIELIGSTGAEAFSSYQIEWQPFMVDDSGLEIILGPWSTAGITLEHGGTQLVFQDRMATFDTSVVGHARCHVRLTVTGHTSLQKQIQVYLDAALKAGWPARIAHDPDAALPNVLDPIVVDLDGDGLVELYALQGATLHGLDAHGAPLTGFPRALPNNSGERVYTTSALTVADIDADGVGEILFASVRNQTVAIGAIERDGTATPGFPLAFTYDGSLGPAVIRADSSVVVDDIDADGADEIVFQAFDLLIVAETDGTLLTGGLVHLRPGASSECTRPSVETHTTRLGSTPAVGDLDGDADLEIAVFHQTPDCGNIGASDGGVVMVFDPDGALLWQRTTQYPAMGSSPAIGDVDGLGGNEIVVAAGEATSGLIRRGGIHVLDGATGDLLPGWPLSETSLGFTASPALADLDGDGDLEIAMADSRFSTLYVHHHDTTSFIPDYNGFFSRGASYTAAITDVNQDGLPDIAASENPFPLSIDFQWFGRGVLAADATGTALPGFPKVIESNAWAPIQVADLDGDGMLEAVASAFKEIGDGYYVNDDFKHRGSIYVWELGVPDMGMPQEWPTFHGNYRRTGRYGDQ